MPAITPALLKKQSLELAGFTHQPELFVKFLQELLEEYADWSYKPGGIGASTTLTPQYHVPNQVLSQISNAVFEVSNKDYQVILPLCEKLWHVPIFECKVLAARLLEHMDKIPDQTILNTIVQWQPYRVDEKLQRILFRHSLSNLIKNHSPHLFDPIDSWLESNTPQKIKSALILLEETVSTPGFDNTPAIFRRINALIRSSSAVAQADLISVLINLAKKFPKETVFIMAENLHATENPEALVYARSVVEHLPLEDQAVLKQAINDRKVVRKNSTTPGNQQST